MDLVVLNYDILPTLFMHFAAVDHDAPYTCMLVCSAWQELVLKTPQAWAYILIDDRIPDMEARCEISLTLSRKEDLVVTIRIPNTAIFRLKHEIGRVSLVILDIIIFEYQNAILEAVELFREIEEHFIYEGLVQWRNNGREIFVYRDGSSVHLDNSLSEVGRNTGRETFVFRDRSYLPLNNTQLEIVWAALRSDLVTSVSNKRVWPKLSLSSTWKSLSLLRSMTYLELYEDYLVGIRDLEDFVPSSLSLYQLKILRLYSYDGQGGYLMPIPRLFTVLQAPNLESMYLDGPSILLISAIRALNPTLCPNVLTLSLKTSRISLKTSRKPPERMSQPVRPWNPFQTLKRLNQVEIEPTQSWNEFSPHFADLLRSAPNLLRCHFIFDNLTPPFGSFIPLIKCPIDVTYLDQTDADRRLLKSWTALLHVPIRTLSLSQLPYPSIKTTQGNTRENVEKKPFGSLWTRVSSWMSPQSEEQSSEMGGNVVASDPTKASMLPPSNTLQYLRTSPNKMVVIEDPSYWWPGIQTFDSNVCFVEHRLVSSKGREAPSWRPFHSLTTINAPTESAAYLIELKLVPCLRDLTVSHLKLDLLIFNYEHAFNRLAEAISMESNEHLCSNLRILGMNYYPPWATYVRLILTVHSRRLTPDLIASGGPQLTLKLPRVPHRRILHVLVKALRGEHCDLVPSPEEQRHFERDPNEVLGCKYCVASGWKCDSSFPICERHSLNNLCSITRYTL